MPSGDWRVDNYVVSGGRGTPKVGPTHTAQIRIDNDGDGAADVNLEVPAYVLRLTHKRNAGVLWIRALPMSTRWEASDLRVLARMYVESASGTDELVELGRGPTERRFASRVVQEGPVAVGGYEGYRVTFEVASLEQLELDEGARWSRVTVVLARTGFRFPPRDTPTTRAGQLPVLTVFGHVNRPEDFEGTSPDFDRMVAMTDFMEEELAESRAALLACTTHEFPEVVLDGSAMRGRFWSPQMSRDELRCYRERLSGESPRRSHGARRVPFRPSGP